MDTRRTSMQLDRNMVRWVRPYPPAFALCSSSTPGMKTCQYFEVKPYEWRGFRQTRGLRSKARRVLSQFSPHDFTAFKWEGTASFMHYFTVVLLLAAFLAAELNPFYLKVGGCPQTYYLAFTDAVCGRICYGWSQITLSLLRG